jgi:4-amino-4-deoxy-L-arabinose transferase-like glycosyltransferase
VRAASWFAVILIAFSVITPKRDLYLLPLYPAIALLCARELAEAQRAGVLARWVTVACAGILLAAGVGLAVAPHVVPELAPYAGGVTSMSVALATAGAAALVFQRRANFADWARSIFGGFAAAALVYALWLVPPINAEKSARALAQYLAQRPEKPTSIACVGVQPEGYRFYGGVPTSKEPLVPALDREGAQFLALVNEKYFRSLPPEVRARVRVLEAQSVGSRDVLVLGAALPRKDDAKARSTGG